MRCRSPMGSGMPRSSRRRRAWPRHWRCASTASCASIWPASAARPSPIWSIALPERAHRGYSDHLRARAQHDAAVSGAWLGRGARRARHRHRRQRASTTRAIRIAGPSSCAVSRPWRALATKAGVEGAHFSGARTADRDEQGRDHPRRHAARGRLRPAPCPAIRPMPRAAPAVDATPVGCAARDSRPPASPIRRDIADLMALWPPAGLFRYHARPRGSVAQSVEQRPFKALVVGSSPTRPTVLEVTFAPKRI